MSLAPGEERILTEIEQQLRRSDLRLAARLALFRHSPFRKAQGPAEGRVSPWRAHPRRPRRTRRLALVAAMVSTLAIAISVLLVSLA
ncbi:MAG TPA: DUF3040 domain-containing protein [Streptosporangiaceae bacterium]